MAALLLADVTELANVLHPMEQNIDAYRYYYNAFKGSKWAEAPLRDDMHEKFHEIAKTDLGNWVACASCHLLLAAEIGSHHYSNVSKCGVMVEEFIGYLYQFGIRQFADAFVHLMKVVAWQHVPLISHFFHHVCAFMISQFHHNFSMPDFACFTVFVLKMFKAFLLLR